MRSLVFFTQGLDGSDLAMSIYQARSLEALNDFIKSIFELFRFSLLFAQMQLIFQLTWCHIKIRFSQ